MSERILEEENEKREDYKIVTFSLAGREFGINIMNVKEIARFRHFTYVPNAKPFVKGVYNLRGEIISVVDLRRYFNLAYPMKIKKEDQNKEEQGLILKVDKIHLGVIVDKIDKVISISSSDIEPAHPIFEDIKQHIRGVISYEGKLCVILNVDSIFVEESDEAEKQDAYYPTNDPDAIAKLDTIKEFERASEEKSETKELAISDDYIEKVTNELRSFINFFVSPINKTWFDKNVVLFFKKGKNINSEFDANRFLENFFSDYTEKLWSFEYLESIVSALSFENEANINILNVGCGKGYESYSLAVGMKMRFPNSIIKIYACDRDFMAITEANTLTFQEEEITDDKYKDYLVRVKGLYAFKKEIKDLVDFEYYDILNKKNMPKIDIIVMRDVLSYFNEDNFVNVLENLEENANNGAFLLIGDNEILGNNDTTNEIFKVQKHKSAEHVSLYRIIKNKTEDENNEVKIEQIEEN